MSNPTNNLDKTAITRHVIVRRKAALDHLKVQAKDAIKNKDFDLLKEIREAQRGLVGMNHFEWAAKEGHITKEQAAEMTGTLMNEVAPAIKGMSNGKIAAIAAGVAVAAGGILLYRNAHHKKQLPLVSREEQRRLDSSQQTLAM